MGDDTNALEQVAEAVEESALTDEDVGELRVLLGKLEDELDVYRDLGDLFSLGGRGYKRVIRAPDGVTSVRRYLDWREEQREQLAEATSADLRRALEDAAHAVDLAAEASPEAAAAPDAWSYLDDGGRGEWLRDHPQYQPGESDETADE